MDYERDWRVDSGTDQTHVVLAAHVTRVRPGTPLRAATQNTWEISPTGRDAKWIAATNQIGGHTVDVWRTATFYTYLRDQFRAGDELDIEYVDDLGGVHLKKVRKGPIDAVDGQRIYMRVPL